MAAPVAFSVEVPEATVARIRERLQPELVAYAPAGDSAWRYGTDATYLRDFVAYWRDRYDWRAAQRELNRFPQFHCEVEGIRIHFLHVRSGSMPRPTLLLTHGWPGSTYEFHAAADLLRQKFDLVIPSLPGYGFSGRPAGPIGPRRTAELWRSLMVEHLGITRFGVQGGDWGSAVASWLANDAPEHVVGLHLNLCSPPRGGEPDEAETAWRAEL
ncbi:MAG TPA: epoxide hydrolase, partial [Acetobacteraceae bacterium]|nr:epoxide hydrolase [Acetobacteraceae bacterium]